MESFDTIASVFGRWSDYMRRMDIEEFETYRHKELRNNKDLGLNVQTEEAK
jgi:hypothetical protein|nr:MAG TPA: acetylcholinesterase [Caudoviricetes sp.]